MSDHSIRIGDVLLHGRSRRVVVGIGPDRLVVCDILSNEATQHRADVSMPWPDALAAGIVGDAIVRCAPRLHPKVNRAVYSRIGTDYLRRVLCALAREMELQRMEDVWSRARACAK